MWYIVVYTTGFESSYSHPYAIHIFTSRKLTPGEAFKTAEEILARTYPWWRSEKREDEPYPWRYSRLTPALKYVGYEEIPLNIGVGSTYYVAVEYATGEWPDVVWVENAASTLGNSVAATIERYRETLITLDYDVSCSESCSERRRVVERVEKAVAFLESMSSTIRVYETAHGYHVRAELKQPLPLSEILYLRLRLGDDPLRLALDRAHVRRQLLFLANALFNEKCAVEDNAVRCREEAEMDIVDGRIYTKELAYMRKRLSTLAEKLLRGDVNA